MSVSGILRAYEQRKALNRQTNAKGNVAQPGHAPDPTRRERELAEDAYIAKRFEEYEGEMIWPDTRREPRSIHSPTQSPRVRFSPPIPKGTGPQKRFSSNGY